MIDVLVGQIQVVVARRKPDRSLLVDELRDRSLSSSGAEELSLVLVDELLEFGLDADGEHNQYGRVLEDLISVVSRQQIETNDANAEP